MRLNVFLNAYGKRNFVGVLEEQNKQETEMQEV